MDIADTDPTRRTAGQYARETVMRMRMRTLVALGVLAVATALLGRGFGLHDVRFLGSEVILLTGIFAILRFVVPIVETRNEKKSAPDDAKPGSEKPAGAPNDPKP